jgi:spore protease
VSTTLSRLGKTIQFSNTGITPGSGVGNHRNKIDRDSLGVPVIAIGIPTIVDSNTLIYSLTDSERESIVDNSNMIVTPYDIDLIIERASRLLALSINCALQPQIEPDFLLSLM